MKYIPVCFLLCACAAGIPLEDVHTIHAKSAPTDQLLLTVLDHELSLATEQAALRWKTATECDISVVQSDGLSVRFGVTSELIGSDGQVARGATHFDSNGAPTLIVFNADYMRQEGGAHRTITHEIGHALGCWRHTEDGSILDAPSASHGKITTNALSCVCERLHCRSFNPEQSDRVVEETLF